MARFVNSWVFVIILFAALCWIVALAGISGVTSECLNSDQIPPATRSESCSRGLQYEWYTVWFELVVLVLLLSLGYSSTFHTYKPAVLAFLVMVTNNLMWSARSFMTVGSFPDNVGNFATKNAAAAGYVLLCMANYLLVWIVGISEPRHEFETWPKEPATVTMSAPAPTPTV